MAVTLQISGLNKSSLAALRKLAKTNGVSTEGYARQLIETGLSRDQRAIGEFFDQLWAPVQARFRDSGMTEDDLDAMVDKARHSHHRRRTKRKS